MAISNGRAINLRSLERNARLLMGGMAITAAIIGLIFKAGLVSNTPDYQRQSWYLVSEHGGFVVTSELDDEASCRKREKPTSICRSGSTMLEQHAATMR